jgi:hypothetical protein
VDDFISTANLATNQIDNWSMTAWVKPSSISQNNGTIVLNGFDDGLTGNGYGMVMGDVTNSSPGNFFKGLIGGVVFVNSAFIFGTNNIWYHTAIVREAGVTKLYFNGTLSGTTTATVPNLPSGSLRIGTSTGLRFWNGSIDEVKIYNTSLTAAQVQTEYLSANNYSSQFGNSVKMNGVNDQIELGSTYTQQIFTVEMWVKPGATQVQYANIIDNNHTGTTNWVCQQNANNTNLYGFGVNTNGVTAGVEFQLQPNVWQHIVLIRGATVVQVYVNGVLVQSNNISGTNIFSGQFLRLGNWGGGGRNWNGTMDEVRYWNTARTQAEIVANMNSQLAGTEAGLVGYWDMNRNGQGAGLTVDNKCVATGAALNGTTLGTASTPIFEPAVTQQKPGSGNAISFDGVNDYVDIPNAANLNFSTSQDFVVETWVKTPVTQNFTGSTDNLIIDKWGGFGSGASYPFSIRIQNAGSPDANKITVIRTNDIGGAAGLNSTKLMNDNKWHQIAFVKSGTQLQLYIDGVLDGTTTDMATGNTANTASLTIGRRNGSTGSGFFTGGIDEVRIWNTALTQNQIRDRMCRKITNSDALYSNLVAYYNFDESTSNTAFDGTANNNSGTLTNNPTRVTSGAPIGNASSHDYVNATKTTSINNAGESFTVTSTSGNPDAIQLYRVDEKPNSETGILGVGPNNRYYGVFQVNGTKPTYSAVYDYTGNPFVTPANESTLALYKRTDNTISTWVNAAATLNTTANTLICTGQSTEYMLGSTGTALPIQLVSFTASNQNNNHLLDWVTSNMVNINRFEVEISNDGIAFTKIGAVASSGLNRYSFINNTVVIRLTIIA